MTEPSNVEREVLPIPDPPYAGPVFEDAKDPAAKFPPIEPLRPPAGAPNVLIVLIDDAGFACSSAFGGPCHTPTAERVAAKGLKLTRFHTTALCSPTRAALLSGRNHHTVGMGGITEIATSAPGYTSVRPNTCAPPAETLKLNGYATAQFGKCHEVPVWETSPLGPFDSWPSGGGGFEYFYGFIGGETNQYYPALYEGTTAVEPEKTPEEGYHLTEDMTDRAIKWIRQEKALMGDKPFFVYFAPRATHAPHHVPEEWSAKYKGKFDQGWDRLREETIARQMEVYADFLEHTDHHVGRLIDSLEDLGILEDTLVYYFIGDNGASGEGDIHGCFNELINLNGANALQTTEFMAERIDKFGTPDAYNHYAVGWAHAMDTPYQWTKQIASHWGGTRNGAIVHWPKGIEAKGEIRNQFHHVIDVAPTILEIAGIPEPKTVHGVAQKPLEGVSMLYAFDDPAAAERHETQYFEMFCNRGIYHQGWTAVTRHSTPWVIEPLPPFAEDTWELYDTNKDWSQAHDLAAEMPEKLEELKALFIEEARKYNVLPLDDRRVERFNSDIAGRPVLITGDSQLLFGGMGRLTENATINVKNKSHSVTAELTVPNGGADGVIVAQGGAYAGWSLYAKSGKPTYCYNLLGVQRFYVAGEAEIPPGIHQVRMEFTYDGGGLGKGGTVALYVDGEKSGEGRVEATVPMIFSADETCDVGSDTASAVSEDYTSENSRFNGSVEWVQIDIAEAAEDLDHLITPEERLKIAMTRQ